MPAPRSSEATCHAQRAEGERAWRRRATPRADPLRGRPRRPRMRANTTGANARERFPMKTLALFVVTAIAEILGCYLTFVVVRKDRSPLLLGGAAVSLALFAYLLTLHPTDAGRT